MIIQEGRNVHYVYEELVNQEFDIEIPRDLADSHWSFIDFVYYKSDVTPVTLTLWLELKHGGPLFKLREVVNFAGQHFYFQIDKDMSRDWTVRFQTTGVSGSGMTQRVALFWR